MKTIKAEPRIRFGKKDLIAFLTPNENGLSFLIPMANLGYLEIAPGLL